MPAPGPGRSPLLQPDATALLTLQAPPMAVTTTWKRQMAIRWSSPAAGHLSRQARWVPRHSSTALPRLARCRRCHSPRMPITMDVVPMCDRRSVRSGGPGARRRRYKPAAKRAVPATSQGAVRAAHNSATCALGTPFPFTHLTSRVVGEVGSRESGTSTTLDAEFISTALGFVALPFRGSEPQGLERSRPRGARPASTQTRHSSQPWRSSRPGR